MDSDMDSAEVIGHIPAEEQLEPLFILEEGDELDDFTLNPTRGKGILKVKKEEMEERIKESSEGSTDSKNVMEAGESMHKHQISQREDKIQQKEGLENQNRKTDGVTETEENAGVQTGPGLVMKKAGGEMSALKGDTKPKEQPLADTQPAVKLRPRDLLSPDDAQRKVMFYMIANYVISCLNF